MFLKFEVPVLFGCSECRRSHSSMFEDSQVSVVLEEVEKAQVHEYVS